MTTTAVELKYVTNVGFAADFGGRGFSLPSSMVIRGDGMIFVLAVANLLQKGRTVYKW